jgi:hypothetical protein
MVDLNPDSRTHEEPAGESATCARRGYTESRAHGISVLNESADMQTNRTDPVKRRPRQASRIQQSRRGIHCSPQVLAGYSHDNRFVSFQIPSPRYQTQDRSRGQAVPTRLLDKPHRRGKPTTPRGSWEGCHNATTNKKFRGPSVGSCATGGWSRRRLVVRGNLISRCKKMPAARMTWRGFGILHRCHFLVGRAEEWLSAFCGLAGPILPPMPALSPANSLMAIQCTWQ